jgi:hypothetical protein
MSSSIFIKNMAGVFPDAASPESLWDNLLSGSIASVSKLDKYWELDPHTYESQDEDGHISMDLGHLASFPFGTSAYPRQIQCAIEVGRNLMKNTTERNFALVLATEWTDPSYYEAELGLKNKDSGYSPEHQLTTIKNELGLKGPALAVDTACASSLYALDLARGLLQSDKNLKGVIVLGLNLYLHSFLYRGFTKLGALSKRKRLRSFDHSADGIVPGEAACAVLVDLNPEEALAEICGLGLSSDGNEGSAFSPGAEGQLAAYARAYEDAGIGPELIDYIEAHGTATVLGDQTEIETLQKFFKRNLIIGSSKANVGHTLAASGLVAVIKAVMMIKNKILPPHIIIQPHPEYVKKNITFLDSPRQLEKDIIYVGVSSFGFGGSNAHLILRTPSARVSKPVIPSTLYIKGMEIRDEKVFAASPTILKDVSMGPRMQERLDPLQRRTLQATQNLIKNFPPQDKKQLSCIFLNNLGGNLSLAYERKYRLKEDGPELSIEGIASTLPSMLTGFPALLFNFRGHHMLISGPEKTLETLLFLAPYLLRQAEGDIIFGGIEDKKKIFLFQLSLDVKNAIGNLQIEKEPSFTGPTTLEALERLLQSTSTTSTFFGQLKLRFEPLKGKDDLHLGKSIIESSEDNKQIALDYLRLLKLLKPEIQKDTTYGDYLVQCEKSTSHAQAQLVVNEEHPYFFDHPLDHIPGILTIHGCEELLSYYLGSGHLITNLTIKFTRFLEKGEPIFLQLHERESGNIDFDIMQGKKRAGTLKAVIKKGEPLPLQGLVPSFPEIEEKKFTHKYRDINVLVGRLNSEKDAVKTLELNDDRGNFFSHLSRPSALYYAEVTRQFVMLLAHLRQKIPLSTKMNLIATEFFLSDWVKPPFEMRLNTFTLTETEDYLVADVTVDYLHLGHTFGCGKIKAQVVSAEYYAAQRGQS